MNKNSNDPSIYFQGTTIIQGDVVYQKIERESDGIWEHKIFYVNLTGKDGNKTRIWENPYPNIKKSLWLIVQPTIMNFINAKSAGGWTLLTNLGDYDEFLDFQTGTDPIRWIAEFILSMGTRGLTDINAYWTEVTGARLHFKRKVPSNQKQ